jgi:DNA-binding LytR/AlgR family response regulator
MINIAVCDDEHAEAAYLTALVTDWANARDMRVRLAEYDSAESFLFGCDEHAFPDILLLDIQMKGMDGVALARKIRRDNDQTQIIFITGYPDFIAEGYDVSALHYLLKPVKEEKLREVLDRAASRIEKSPRMITFPKTGGAVRIAADDIVLVEVFSHTVVVEYLGGKEEFQMRLSDAEELLGDGFFKCHRSYIVAMKYVRRVTKAAVILTDGRQIPLSRKLYDTANQAFINYN